MKGVVYVLLAVRLFSSLYSLEETAPSRSVCLVVRDEFRGEREFAERIKVAAKTLQMKLAEQSYTNLFGNPEIGIKFGAAYRGAIEYDGQRVLEAVGEMGICLVFHSKTHLEYGILSGRIFEAAAASTVIISDLNRS